MNSCTMTPYRRRVEKHYLYKFAVASSLMESMGVWRPLYFRGLEAVADYTALQGMGQSGGERSWCLKHNPQQML